MKQKTLNGSLALLAAAFVVFGVNGCTSQSSSRSGGHVPRVDTVVIENMQFDPAELQIQAGDTVVWINRGIVTHDVTEASKAWTSGDIEVEASWRTVPDGSFDYYCSIHPTMKGTVRVQKVK